MSQDEAIKAAGDILIAAFPDNYGPITFNMRGPRTCINSNVTTKLSVECGDRSIDVDIKDSKVISEVHCGKAMEYITHAASNAFLRCRVCEHKIDLGVKKVDLR